MNISFYIPGAWFIYHTMEYFLHRLSHNPKLGYIYKIHKKHHTIHYPITDLMSDNYKTDYIYGLSDGLLAHGPPTISIIRILYLFLDKDTFLKLSSCILFTAYISDYFHTHIHTRDSKFVEYPWFIKMREMHFNHHKNTSKNFNILDTNIDKLMKTYK
jgi:sterol desaturase/sphingolipid hydroxylase (fatty acid hydroxylase superfamily)